MPRNLHARALPPLLVFLQMSLAPAIAAAGGTEHVEAGPQAPSVVLQALESWLRAVDQHQPGVRDEAVALVSPWSGADLGALLAEGLLPLLRACGRPVPGRLPTVAGIAAPRQRDRLSETEAAFIRQLAAELCRTEPGLASAPPHTAVDHMLRGGAMLHGDAGMLALPDPETGVWPSMGATGPRGPVGRGSAMSVLADGTQRLLPNTTAAHWAMARILLDQVRTDSADSAPSPARDPMVRSWYRATLALMAAIPYGDTAHLERAGDLFGDDPIVQLLIGSTHEWMASDGVQRATEPSSRFTLPREPGSRPRMSQRFPVGSRDAELQRARRHLEAAVRLDASLTEARIRLGRVLGLMGHHQDAAMALREAVAAEPEPLLSYYAHLFLGAEEEALGRYTEARDGYERAAVLYPEAATPRLALSHLMRRQGRRDEALRLIREVLADRPKQAANPDPIRRYSRAAGRQAKALQRETAHLYLEASPAGGRRPAAVP